MNPKVAVSILLISVTLLFGGIFLVTRSEKPPVSDVNLDNFAKCLTDKGIVMYGAAWCSHCQKQKKAFGTSFQYIKYVECPDNPTLCTDKGVTGYPTWIFPDDHRLEGEISFEKLSSESGCSLTSSTPSPSPLPPTPGK